MYNLCKVLENRKKKNKLIKGKKKRILDKNCKKVRRFDKNLRHFFKLKIHWGPNEDSCMSSK